MTSSAEAVYLFAGDSLTEGIYGESYVQRVGEAVSEGQAGLRGEVATAGRGCDTVKSLLNRLDQALGHYHPQWVVLAIGSNDVWLPWLSSHSVGWWLWYLYRRLRWGQEPTTDLDQFGVIYRTLIDRARQAGAHVLVCTVPPIGERLSSPVNRRMARLNGVIKHVAADRQVPVADVWQAFVQAYTTLSKPSGYMAGEWLFTWLDRRRLERRTPDQLGQRRGLHLTFDGIHLNSRGAKLWAETVLAALVQNQSAARILSPAGGDWGSLSCFERGPIQVCHSPGWEARAEDVARLAGEAHQCLASLTGARPKVRLAVLNPVHWKQLAAHLPFAAPAAQWGDGLPSVFVPEAYGDEFLRRAHVPVTVSLWTAWPPGLEEVGELARATALADLLVVRELASLFLCELKVAPADPALNRLLTAYLTEVAIHARRGRGAGEMAALWDFWGEVAAASSRDGTGQHRIQAKALFKKHGDGLVASFAGPLSARQSRELAALAAAVPDSLRGTPG